MIELPDILDIDVSGFERLIKTYVQKMEFDVESSVTSSDGTIKIIAKTTNPMGGSIKSIIWAAPYEKTVGKGVVEELYADMKNNGAVRAALITTSDFAVDAVEYAREKPISLVNKYQLIESLEKRGILIEPQVWDLLEQHGLTERRYGSEKHLFMMGKVGDEVVEYFEKKRKKKIPGGRSEVIGAIKRRYAPVCVFKVTYSEGLDSDGKSLSTVERDDFMYINLNNANLFYIQETKKFMSPKKYDFMVSDIMGKIMDLPEESKEHLTHLIQHGEIPEKYMEDKFVSILFSNKIIVKREEGKSEGPLMDFVRLATLAVEEVVDFIPLFADSILGTTSNLEHKTAEVKEPEKISMVGAKVNLPGGVFDLRKFLVVRRGSDATVEEEDDVKYPSNKIAEMLSVILNARVKPQGLIFMPYYLCSYVDENTHSLIRREILFIPKFIPPEETKRAREVKKPVKKTQTHVGIPYKILK